MSGLGEFWRRGAEDADRRVAGFLAPGPFGAADRYLKSSVVVQRIDRLTRRLWSLASGSRAMRAASALRQAWARAGWRDRYQAIGLVLIVAVGVHLAAILLRGQESGWFWMIVPALAAIFALILLAASRATPSVT